MMKSMFASHLTPEMMACADADNLNSGLDSVEWSSDAVRDMFVDGGSGGDESSETPVGAIAGGVVGGVAGIAIIGALVFFFLRRRRRSQDTIVDVPEPSSTPGTTDQKPPEYYAELHQQDTPRPAELEPQQYRSELGTESETQTAPMELPTEANRRVEAQA